MGASALSLALLLATSASVRAEGMAFGHGAAPLPASERADGGGPYREAIEEALDAFNRERWADAHAAFERAHALEPSARTLRGLGLSAFYMADYVESAEAFGDALSAEHRPLTADQREQVVEYLDRAMERVGRVRVELSPRGAKLLLDGSPVTVGEGEALLLQPGQHALQAQRDGYDPAQRTIWVAPGEQMTVILVLTEAESSTLRATLERAVTTPPAPPAVAPSQAVGPSPARTEPAPRVWTWVALGGAAALGATSGLLWLEGDSELDAVARACRSEGCTVERRARLLEASAVDEYELWSNATLIASGAAAATAVALFFIEGGDLETPTREQQSVSVGPGSVNLRLQF